MERLILLIGLLMLTRSQQQDFFESYETLDNVIRRFMEPDIIPRNSVLRLLTDRPYNVSESGSELKCDNLTLSADNPLAIFLQNSGQSVNDLGLYDSCKDLRKN